ncbi:MAG: LysM peptidoglycan-binding domain-containing protein [Gemmatimonadota bacterium]|nr:LysM peptidoglycan-binding domain-containing protein [Gemmatimonadota bacterium]
MNGKARTGRGLATLVLPGLAAVAMLGLPATAAAQDAETGGAHEVRRGDTLWDIAARYLADPFRWPDIFRLNPDVVEDPDRIYPGERLRLPGAAPSGPGARPSPAMPARPGRAVGTEPARTASGGSRGGASDLAGTVFAERSDGLSGSSALAIAERPPSPLISRSDFYGIGRLLPELALEPAGTTARTIERSALSLAMPPSARPHHEVMIAAGDLRASTGDLLQAVRWARPVAERGRILSSLALLETVDVTGDSIRARVLELYGGYQAGDLVIAAEPFAPDPDARPVPSDVELRGSLLAFETPQWLPGPHDAVLLDVGADDGVRMGDEFLVYGPGVADPARVPRRDALLRVRVVRTTPRTASAVVAEVRGPGARDGSPVLLVARLPDGT